MQDRYNGLTLFFNLHAFVQKKPPSKVVSWREDPTLRVVLKKLQMRSLKHLPQLKIDSRGFTLVAC